MKKFLISGIMLFINLYVPEFRILSALFFWATYKCKSIENVKLRYAWLLWGTQTDPDTGVSSIKVNRKNVLLCSLGVGVIVSSIFVFLKYPDNLFLKQKQSDDIKLKFLSVSLECVKIGNIVELLDTKIATLIRYSATNAELYGALFKDVSRFQWVLSENSKEVPLKCSRQLTFIFDMLNLICSQDREVTEMCKQGFIQANTQGANLQNIEHIFSEILK